MLDERTFAEAVDAEWLRLLRWGLPTHPDEFLAWLAQHHIPPRRFVQDFPKSLVMPDDLLDKLQARGAITMADVERVRRRRERYLAGVGAE